jgi:HEAT repeat protein
MNARAGAVLAAGLAMWVASAGPAWAQRADSLIGGKSLDEWIKDIHSRDASVREHAIQMVLEFGRDGARRATPELLKLLEKGEEDTSPRVNAAIALGMIGAEDPIYAKRIVAQFSKLLMHDTQGIVRFHAARGLGMIATTGDADKIQKILPELRGAIPTLVTQNRGTRDTASWEIRRASAFALGRIAIAADSTTPPDKRAFIALAYALRDYTAQVRIEAVKSIIFLGVPAEDEDVLALRKALLERISTRPLVETNPQVRTWSRVALAKIDLPELKKLRDDTATARVKPGRLKELESALDTHLTAIAKMINPKEDDADLQYIAKQVYKDEKNPSVRKVFDQECRLAACAALGMLGPDARSKVPQLVEALDSDDPHVVMAAINALAQIGHPDAVPYLKKMEGHRESAIKFAAENAIAEITGVAAPKKDDKDKKK